MLSFIRRSNVTDSAGFGHPKRPIYRQLFFHGFTQAAYYLNLYKRIYYAQVGNDDRLSSKSLAYRRLSTIFITGAITIAGA